MKHQHYKTLLVLLPLLSLSAVHAQTSGSARPDPVATTSETRPLNPTQLSAIRGVSRNVLAAKKSGAEDGADAAQLASLRASLDQLIAAELAPENLIPITLQGQESGAQRSAKEKILGTREKMRADARALAAQLRQRGEINASRARSTVEDNTRSAGLPIGEQRARMFERWAQKLDTALADDNADRTVQLRNLREQLSTTSGRLSDAPITHGTPTLQAMPADFVPLKSSVTTNGLKE